MATAALSNAKNPNGRGSLGIEETLWQSADQLLVEMFEPYKVQVYPLLRVGRHVRLGGEIGARWREKRNPQLLYPDMQRLPAETLDEAALEPPRLPQQQSNCVIGAG